MKDKKKVFASLFIAFIMVFSIFGFILSYSLDNETVKYNGHKFVNTEQGWLTVINGERFFFAYTPKDVETWINEEVKNQLKNTEQLTFSYNPNDLYSSIITESILQLNNKLHKFTKKQLNFGLTNNSGYSLPLITCSNASEQNPVVLFEESNENSSIDLDNHCIKIRYTTQSEILQQTTALSLVLTEVI
ncbi:hypothetical protein HY837_00745 [archaeon]|nr:hypothetical protein [archaeon]